MNDDLNTTGGAAVRHVHKNPEVPQTRPAAVDRIKSIDELAEICEAEKSAGRTVVLAHGAFDLLHLGHVRHLEAARKLGDVLIVTVTADAFIKKGPDRPVFPEMLRAEMVAALECVDWSGIHRDASAEDMLRRVRPSVYVKGSDYANASEDVTGKIIAEREAVESYGGRIAFTDDVVFSSSKLINDHVLTRDPGAQDIIRTMKAPDRRARVFDLIENIADTKALFVGETILDEYVYVQQLGRTAKGNHVSTRYLETEIFAGGVIAAANQAAGLVGEVTVLTCLGNDGMEQLVRSALHPKVRLEVVQLDDKPTINKRRYLTKPNSPREHLHKLFEVTNLDQEPIAETYHEQIRNEIKRLTPEHDVMVVCDFGHGMIDSDTVNVIQNAPLFVAVNAQANSANHGFNLITKYDKSDLMCIDEPEARLCARDATSPIDFVIRDILMRQVEAERIIVTQGSKGSICVDRQGEVTEVPGFAYDPVDTIGAGDAFLAVAAPLLSAGGNNEDVCFIANVVGGMKVNVVGHRSGLDKGALLKSIKSLLT